jgi:hypothetical protein
MSDWETTIVPLDDAHEVLGTFGIGAYNKAYQRWRRDDGFRLGDLEDVLNESALVLTVDWRECLPYAVETVEAQLESLGIAMQSDMDEEGTRGSVEVDGRREALKYCPADEDDFDAVMLSINRLIEDKAHYRKFRSNEGTDGWQYGVLANADWTALESNAPNVTELLFASVAAAR